MTVCEIIEQETGQKVDFSTPIDDLQVDSLEFLYLLIKLDVPADNIIEFHTVGDLVRARTV